MNMKKYIIKVILTGFCLGTLACTNLDEEVFSQVTNDNFFKTEEEFVSALGAAYSNLTSYMGNGNMFSLQEVTSDEIVVPTRGADWDDGGNWRRLHRHTYTAEDDRIRDGWGFCFSGISTCNRLIDQFEELANPDTDPFIAELKVLRGLYYYWLLDTYGKVPIVTGFADADPAPASNTRQEVYDFVVKEVTENLSKLSDKSGLETYGRINQFAAHAILAKVYLNAEVYTGTPQWENALTSIQAITQSGKFSLTPDYFENFNEENSGSTEFILAIPYDEVFFKGFNTPMMTLHYGNQNTYNLTAQPWNGFCSMEEFYNSYEEDDLRRGIPADSKTRGNFLAGQQFKANGEPITDSGYEKGDPNNPDSPNDPDGENVYYTPEINELGPFALRQSGVRIGKFEFANGATDNLSNDFAIFRYSDFVLMEAEVLMRLNRASEGLPLVNLIRERAGVDAFEELTPENMLEERGREMFAEVYRRQDLIRFGKYNEAWWEKPASDDHVNVFPVPRGQLDSNPNLKQNDGY